PAKLIGYGGIGLRTSSSEWRRGITPPKRKLARPPAFENVPATNKFGYFRIHGIGVSPEYYAYAPSKTTAARGATFRILPSSGKGTSVPVGLFGFAKKKTRGLFFSSFKMSSRENRISVSYLHTSIRAP